MYKSKRKKKYQQETSVILGLIGRLVVDQMLGQVDELLQSEVAKRSLR